MQEADSKSELPRLVARAGGGARTRDTRFTKPVLCQLSYSGERRCWAAVGSQTVTPH